MLYALELTPVEPSNNAPFCEATLSVNTQRAPVNDASPYSEPVVPVLKFSLITPWYSVPFTAAEYQLKVSLPVQVGQLTFA